MISQSGKKIRDMQIIADLEGTTRGPYAGCVGYFSFNGNLDTCITSLSGTLTFSVPDSKFRLLPQFIALAKASCTTSSFGISEISAQTTAASCQKTAVNPFVSYT